MYAGTLYELFYALDYTKTYTETDFQTFLSDSLRGIIVLRNIIGFIYITHSLLDLHIFTYILQGISFKEHLYTFIHGSLAFYLHSARN